MGWNKSVAFNVHDALSYIPNPLPAAMQRQRLVSVPVIGSLNYLVFCAKIFKYMLIICLRKLVFAWSVHETVFLNIMYTAYIIHVVD